jgi:predicted CoA-binding protein
MTTRTLEARVHEFLAQKRIAVAGVSRDDRNHPTGNLIYRRLKKTGHQVFAVNPNTQTFEGDRCYPDVRSIPGGIDGVVIVTPAAVEYCRQHDIDVIAGACPMMYGEGVDFGHACMRWILKVTGGLPT